MLLAVLLSPLLGALADLKRNKKIFFVTAASIAILSTGLLYYTGPGQVVPAMLLVITGYAGYTVAMTFYNSFLSEVATSGAVEKVSGIGWGMGTLEGLRPSSAWFFWSRTWRRESGDAACRNGVWPFCAAVLSHPQGFTRQDRRPGRLNRCRCSRIIATFKEIRAYRRVFLFLLGYFFVSDAMSTVIVFFLILYRAHSAFHGPGKHGAPHARQLSAAAGSVATGLLAQRIGPLQR